MREDVFHAAIVQHRIPWAGEVLLKEMWRRDLSKLARPAGGCVDHRMSRKMGRRIALSGRNIASPVSELYERDPTVLGYWHQPFEHEWKTYDSNGRATGRKHHHPMFVVLRASGFSVIDFFNDSELLKRFGAGQDYVLDDATQDWRWLTAEQEYDKINLAYEVHSVASIPYVLLDNVNDLDRYHRDDSAPLSPDECSRVLAAFESVGFMTIRECVDGHGFQGDTIRKAIDSGLVAFDLINERLNSAESVVFRDYDLLEAWRSSQDPPKTLPLPGNGIVESGDHLRYQGKSYIAHVFGDQVILQGQGSNALCVGIDEASQLKSFNQDIRLDGSVEPRLRAEFFKLSDSERKRGIARLQYLEGKLDTGLRPCKRTAQRWRALIKTAHTRPRKIVALGTDRRPGNREPRFTEKHEDLARDVIHEVFDGTPSATKAATYRVYLNRCREQGIEPMCRPAFEIRVDIHSVSVNKLGKRANYKVASLRAGIRLHNSPHGGLPHQLCHIDHTQADVEVIHPFTRKNLGRPWLTLVWEPATKQARAMYMSFRAPNTASCLMAIRDYARRWPCIAKEYVVDRATDLSTESVHELKDALGCKIRQRKGTDPRSGSPIESQNSAREKEVDMQMHGNTSHLKSARLYTGKTSPKDDAEWTFPGLYRAYEEYFFHFRTKINIDVDLGMTPEAYELHQGKYCGVENFIPAEYDFDLLVLTAPLIGSGERKIQQSGIWVLGEYYTNNAIFRAKTGTFVPVRAEPQCAAVIYVYIEEEWKVAYSRNPDLRHFTSYELSIADRQNYTLTVAEHNRARLLASAVSFQDKLLRAEEWDERLAIRIRCMEESTLLDSLGLGVELDEETHQIRYGVVKPLMDINNGDRVEPCRTEAAVLEAASTPITPTHATLTSSSEPFSAEEIVTQSRESNPSSTRKLTEVFKKGGVRNDFPAVTPEAWRRTNFYR
ncbi:hypothetical protein [Cupriavidus sp. TMH.W2]|uniref:hypothetical protein n=1 Tax=Cupriavidus sp. TMH.W2 TaxID=3434465 RepID=UPI003D77696A